MPASRQLHRRRRELNLALDAAPNEYRPDLDYDRERESIMDTIDQMDPEWRALVNEHGFTPVVKALRSTDDLDQARKILAERHQLRQAQLAIGTG
jgi:hypothetical protein